MDNSKLYALPNLAYGYKDLEPYISEQQLTLHHQKHHQAYVNGANAVMEKLAAVRSQGSDIDMKAALKELSFQLSGHILHSLFWKNMAPRSGGQPSGKIAEMIAREFGSFERFRLEFTKAAVSAEGSGWAALALDHTSNQLILMQIEKHNVNLAPALKLLLVLDVWEHAYYLDYKNERAKFVEAFWNLVSWEEVNNRLQ